MLFWLFRTGLLITLVALAIVDIYHDVKAAKIARKFDSLNTVRSLNADSAELDFKVIYFWLCQNAPSNTVNPFEWTVRDTPLSFFEECGDIKSIALRENGETLFMRIKRGNTLEDEVQFTDRDGCITGLKLIKYWHGRPLPLFSTIEYRLSADDNLLSAMSKISDQRFRTDLYVAMKYKDFLGVWYDTHQENA